ncbi:MAG: hypothetical protein IJ323_01520 [Clostridia bacterium]|nr:hypothetical protein [Clostridia bacterium]
MAQKKFLPLLLILCMLTCALALGVSAEETEAPVTGFKVALVKDNENGVMSDYNVGYSDARKWVYLNDEEHFIEIPFEITIPGTYDLTLYAACQEIELLTIGFKELPNSTADYGITQATTWSCKPHDCGEYTFTTAGTYTLRISDNNVEYKSGTAINNYAMIKEISLIKKADAPTGITVDGTIFKNLDPSVSYMLAPWYVNGPDSAKAKSVVGATSVDVTDELYFGESAVGLYGLYIAGDGTNLTDSTPVPMYIRGSISGRATIGNMHDRVYTKNKTTDSDGDGTKDVYEATINVPHAYKSVSNNVNWIIGGYSGAEWPVTLKADEETYSLGSFFTNQYFWYTPTSKNYADALAYEAGTSTTVPKKSSAEILKAVQDVAEYIQIRYAYTADEIIPISEVEEITFYAHKQYGGNKPFIITNTEAKYVFYIMGKDGRITEYTHIGETFATMGEQKETLDVQSLNGLPQEGWLVGWKFYPLGVVDIEDIAPNGTSGTETFSMYFYLPNLKSSAYYVIDKPVAEGPTGITVDGRTVSGLKDDYAIAPYTIVGAKTDNAITSDKFVGGTYTLPEDAAGLYAVYAVETDEHYASKDKFIFYLSGSYAGRATIGNKKSVTYTGKQTEDGDGNGVLDEYNVTFSVPSGTKGTAGVPIWTLGEYTGADYYHGYSSKNLTESDYKIFKSDYMYYAPYSAEQYNAAVAYEAMSDEEKANATKPEKTSAEMLVDVQALLQSIRVRYAYDSDDIIPIGDVKSIGFSTYSRYGNVYPYKISTANMKYVFHVMNEDGEVKEYTYIGAEKDHTPGAYISETVDVQNISELPEEGWLVGWEYYPFGVVPTTSILPTGSGTRFSITYTLPNLINSSSYVIEKPKAEKPTGVTLTGKTLTGLSSAYTVAPYVDGVIDTENALSIDDYSEGSYTFTPRTQSGDWAVYVTETNANYASDPIIIHVDYSKADKLTGISFANNTLSGLSTDYIVAPFTVLGADAAGALEASNYAAGSYTFDPVTQAGLWGIYAPANDDYDVSTPVIVYVKGSWSGRADLGNEITKTHAGTYNNGTSDDTSDDITVSTDLLVYDYAKKKESVLEWSVGQIVGADYYVYLDKSDLSNLKYLLYDLYKSDWMYDLGTSADLFAAIEAGNLAEVQQANADILKTISVRYAYEPEEIIPVDEIVEMKFSSGNGTQYITVGKTKYLVELYVMTPDGEIEVCSYYGNERTITGDVNANVNYEVIDVQNAFDLPEEGWVVGYKFYPYGGVDASSIVHRSETSTNTQFANNWMFPSGYFDGFYTIKEEDHADFGMSLVLDGKVGVKITATVDETVKNLTLANVTGTDNYVGFTNNEAIFYVNPKDVATAEISFDVTYTDAEDEETESYTITVAEYVGKLQETETDATTLALVNAFETYYTAAAAYFDDTAADAEVLDVLTSDELADLISKRSRARVETENLEVEFGLIFHSTSLLLEDDTTIRHYFEIVGGDTMEAVDIESIILPAYKVEGGSELALASSTSDAKYAYTDVSGIPSNALSEAKEVTVKFADESESAAITVTFSALDYVELSLEDENAELRDLVKALYRYSAASDAYNNAQ